MTDVLSLFSLNERQKTKTRIRPLNVTLCASPSPLTSDTEERGAFGSPQAVLCDDRVLSHVFGAHAQDGQGANSAGVGDVIVGVGV